MKNSVTILRCKIDCKYIFIKVLATVLFYLLSDFMRIVYKDFITRTPPTYTYQKYLWACPSQP